MEHITDDLPAPRLGDRGLFPDLEAAVYLNHAAISPPSRRIQRALHACIATYAARGVEAFFTYNQQRAELRQDLAALLGADAGEIALTSGTSAGVIDVALCFPWRAGDRVVLFDGEFPANITPWQRAAAAFDLRTTLLPLEDYMRSHAPGLERLEATLRAGGVRLVAVSSVQFRTGLRMPIREIAALCREHGAELFVDAIQGCGATPLDVEADGIDYLACGGHKHLMGVEGAGFLYVRQARAAALRPNVAGWLSHEEPVGFLVQGPGHLRYDRPIRQRADMVEAGGWNALGHAALGAAVKVTLGLGVEAIHAHVAAYLDALEPALRERGFRSLRHPDPAGRSTLLCVLPPEGRDVVALHRALGARGVASSIPDGVLRFAPHWPNSQGELPTLLAAIDAALADA
ncbi:MAG: aminotransferase class V-fold PLP-dependent enzyme [Myxococcales bacterium]|nr:aminotransferase class V-fold PLP-dependent enzyme [Myxococcales bacterium]MCB9570153.1 aminotransferase class V-fold PLP-dependent enzyme [Myxococcales bacterium]MCB9705178.1 aminotransferase class V-fold PLP-dependent enzyme [Myxococcales bacterium]